MHTLYRHTICPIVHLHTEVLYGIVNPSLHLTRPIIIKRVLSVGNGDVTGLRHAKPNDA